MSTIKLYNDSSYTKEFDALVLSCESADDLFRVVLDRTAFFPESGGQFGDTGYIDGIAVTDTQIDNEVILHTTGAPVEVGKTVHCSLDWEKRFSRMQNHTGEHICCGHAHRLWGCENVGFHLGDTDVTFDLDKELDEAQIRQLEMLANRTAISNAAVRTYFPKPEELSSIEYRSKLELTENVRIVEIEGCDVCACCAPHVERTGEIGMIKLLEHIKWKGGTRIHLRCGFSALENFNDEYAVADKNGALLSVPHERIFEAVTRMNNELNEKKQELKELRKRLALNRIASAEVINGNICLFEEDFGIDDLRVLCNNAPEYDGMCACFSKNANGYIYVIASRTLNMRDKAKEINKALRGKGGGSECMIQGSVQAAEEEIAAYFR